MPRYKPNIKFSDCWSSIGRISFYHRDGKCYWRSKPSPIFPGTSGQLAQSSVHHRAIMAWKSISSREQHQWRRMAQNVPAHRPPFLKENHISGYNLFVSAYHGFAQLDMEHIPVPQQFPLFPTSVLTYTSALVVGSSILQINCNLLLGGTHEPARFRLSARIQLERPGVGRNPGHMRTYLAETISIDPGTTLHTAKVVLTISDYISMSGLDIDTYQVHMRYRLIDTVTGFRNNFNDTSFLMVPYNNP